MFAWYTAGSTLVRVVVRPDDVQRCIAGSSAASLSLSAVGEVRFRASFPPARRCRRECRGVVSSVKSASAENCIARLRVHGICTLDHLHEAYAGAGVTGERRRAGDADRDGLILGGADGDTCTEDRQLPAHSSSDCTPVSAPSICDRVLSTVGTCETRAILSEMVCSGIRPDTSDTNGIDFFRYC